LTAPIGIIVPSKTVFPYYEIISVSFIAPPNGAFRFVQQVSRINIIINISINIPGIRIYHSALCDEMKLKIRNL